MLWQLGMSSTSTFAIHVMATIFIQELVELLTGSPSSSCICNRWPFGTSQPMFERGHFDFPDSVPQLVPDGHDKLYRWLIQPLDFYAIPSRLNSTGPEIDDQIRLDDEDGKMIS